MSIIDLIQAPIKLGVDSFIAVLGGNVGKNKGGVRNGTYNMSNNKSFSKNKNKNKKTGYGKAYPNFIPKNKTIDVNKLNVKIRGFKL